MPKSKSSTTASAAPKRPRASKKSAPKTIRPRKKAKAVLVDVIEDDIKESSSGWLKEQPAEVDVILKHNQPEEKLLSQYELDKQKKFYAELAAQMKKDSPDDKDEEKKPRCRVGLYRRLVIKFVLLVLVIAGVIAYFSFSKLTVSLSLKGESLNNNLLFKVSSASSTPEATDGAYSSSAISADLDPREAIRGSVQTLEVKVSETYPATGETFLGDEVSGQVRIINNYSKDQPLVATTRLLSKDNKLFRIKEAVNVPAGGEVVVDIYADKPTADMAIGPADFTIPGLWAGLQDKIYARSDKEFFFTKKVQKHINASDLELATKDINRRLLEQAKGEANSTLGSDWLYQVDGSPSVDIEAKIGDKKDSFTATATGRIIAVSFDKEQAGALAKAKLDLTIPSDKELAEFDPTRISYSFENYDASSNSATIKAIFNGTMILKQDSSLIDPRQLVNLSSDQIASYLRDRPEVKEFSLDFSPTFIKRAPSLADRIKIEIRKN